MKISKDKKIWGVLALSTMIAGGTIATAIAQTTAGKTTDDPAKAAKLAEKKAGEQKDGIFKGKVSEVGGGKITLVNAKEGQTKTFTITDATKIKVSEQPGTLADVKVGMAAGAKPDAEGKVALELQAWVPHQKQTKPDKTAKDAAG